MRIRYNPEARPALAACPFYIDDPKAAKGRWNTLYKNDLPLWLELGCGKGSFIANTAFNDRGHNYLAVDIKSEMLYLAMKNTENVYGQTPIDNLLLADMEIMIINNYFDENDRIDRIFINFCNPWPKAKHKKRRLTHPNQLNQYRIFLKDGGKIVFRTDDEELFTESLDYFPAAGYEIIEMASYNSLDSETRPPLVATEHELMFLETGKTINYLVAEKCAR